jgi:hypothetical protein
MDAQEVKDRLKSVINNLIKDDPTAASQDLHDVLAAKMRARISPETAEEVVATDSVADDVDADEGENADVTP